MVKSSTNFFSQKLSKNGLRIFVRPLVMILSQFEIVSKSNICPQMPILPIFMKYVFCLKYRSKDRKNILRPVLESSNVCFSILKIFMEIWVFLPPVRYTSNMSFQTQHWKYSTTWAQNHLIN